MGYVLMISIFIYVMGKKYYVVLMSTILVLCNHVISSKNYKLFQAIQNKIFSFCLKNVSTYFSAFVKIDRQIIYIFTEN